MDSKEGVNQYRTNDRANLFILHKRNYNQTDNIGYEKITNLLLPLENKVVLDYGSGSGDNARALKQLGAKLVVGVEADSSLSDNYSDPLYDNLSMSEKSIDIENEEGILIKKIDYNNAILPEIIPDLSIDAIVSYYVFCEIGNKETIKSIFSTFNDKLKQGGKLFLQMPNRDKFNGKESYGFKFIDKKDLKEGDSVATILRTNEGDIDSGLLLSDFYRPQSLLKDILGEVGFKDINIHELLASKNLYKNIKDELEYSPIYIIEATK